ncbi:MAG: hypothetical protein A3F18_01155 [Legionellales bacterium RIFCSPHIGHO2_12_FULL_37_14]|nr:MAG: hypothetical protein A3F18_01155 [Legionellales bacterium RIFCSPHIGHO2_12_FULL_37_14]
MIDEYHAKYKEYLLTDSRDLDGLHALAEELLHLDASTLENKTQSMRKMVQAIQPPDAADTSKHTPSQAQPK